MKKKISVCIMLVAATIYAIGQGAYVEYKLSSGEGVGGTMKMYFQDGNSRSEMEMQIPGMPGGGMNNASVYLKSNPDKIYMLNEKNKTYSEMDISKLDNAQQPAEKNDEYEVTVVGKEKVNSYNATHVKVKHKGSKTEMDMWTSADVANYASYQNIKSKYTSVGLYKALKEKGADGVIVRMVVGDHGHNMQMDLIKAETKSVDAAKFSLAGYTKSERPSYGPGPGADRQELMEKMKNMTPEERKEMIEQMRKAHGGE
jgi:hypothetical protein